MSKTSIILTTTEATTGKKRKRSFSDINPNATNEELKNFAVNFNALTTNQYVETNRVDTINVDTESSGKSFRNLTITGATRGASATITSKIRAGGTITPAVFYYTTGGSVQLLSPTSLESDDPTIAKFSVTIPNTSGYVYVGLMKDTNFYADFINQAVE